MNTTVTFRTDEKLKKEASKVFNSLGVNLSTALNMFMRQAVIKKGFPCDIDLSTDVVDPRLTYPEGFFELFGTLEGLGFPEEIEELPYDTKDINL